MSALTTQPAEDIRRGIRALTDLAWRYRDDPSLLHDIEQAAHGLISELDTVACGAGRRYDDLLKKETV